MVFDNVSKLHDTDEQDGMDKLILESMPSFVRLEIPLKEVHNYRRYADILRGLANSFDLMGRRDDIPVRYRVGDMRGEVDMANKKLKQGLE